MRPDKVTGLAIFRSFAVFGIWLAIPIMSGTVSNEPAHATGLSAVVGGILEAFTWLVIAMAFAAALLWLTRKSKRTTTSRSTPPPRP